MYSMLIGFILPLVAGLQTATSQEKNFELLFTTNSITEGTKAYLVYQTNGQKIMDSAIVQHNTIRFLGKVRKPLPATVVVDHQHRGLQQLLRQEPENVDFLKIYLCAGISEANTGSRISGAVFKGPGINHDYAALKLKEKAIEDQWSTVSRQIIRELDTVKLRMLRHRYDSLSRERIPVLKQFVLEHPGSFISLVAWEEYKGYLQRQNGNTPNESSISEIRALFDRLSPGVKNSEEAMEARRFFENITGLKQGLIAPDFSQPDAAGKIVNLSDFRGRYVLLDFWASWCGPCRANNPGLVKLYREFKDRNFTILGISLDEKDGREKWLKAIKNDGLTWPQVSDLRHWDNAVVKLYSVSAVPYNLLIDPQGRIVTLDGSVQDIRKLLHQMLPAKK